MANKSNPDRNRTITVKWYLLFVLFLYFTIACKLTETTIATATITPQEDQTLETSVLENLICEPPCWAGISPGQTTKQDAIKLLNIIKTEKDEISFYETGAFNGVVVVFYLQVSKPNSNVFEREILFQISDNLVQEINFRGELNTRLAQAIEIVGAPEGAINLPYPVELLLLYPSRGVILFPQHVSGAYLFSSQTLEPESIITEIFFFDPENWDATIGKHLVEKNVIDQYMVPWDGYGPIEEKYPEPIWTGK